MRGTRGANKIFGKDKREMLKNENGSAVWFSSELSGDFHRTVTSPQVVKKSVENLAVSCEELPQQPPESCEKVKNLPRIVSGFATRHGGVSTLAHLSDLNFGFSVGEERATTLENYRRFSAALEIPYSAMLCANQTHTARVLTVDRTYCGMGLDRTFAEVLSGTADADAAESGFDGFVTRESGVALVVRAADCVPILFWDPTNHVIGACHAGWRGTVGGIAAETVQKMCALGAAPETVCAAIGPAVCLDCYEVDDAFRETFSAALGTAVCEKIFAKSPNYENKDKWHCDLRLCNALLLEAAGLLPGHIDNSALCTCCHPEMFHSHRYAVKHNGGKRGLGCGCVAMME